MAPVVENLLAVCLALCAVKVGAQQRRHQHSKQPAHPQRQRALRRRGSGCALAQRWRWLLPPPPLLLLLLLLLRLLHICVARPQPGKARGAQPLHRLVHRHLLIPPQAHKAAAGQKRALEEWVRWEAGRQDGSSRLAQP